MLVKKLPTSDGKASVFECHTNIVNLSQSEAHNSEFEAHGQALSLGRAGNEQSVAIKFLAELKSQ